MLGLARRRGARTHARRGRRRRAHRQHVRVHRQGQAGVGGHHPRDGRAQEDGRLPHARGHRLPGRALPRRTARADPRDRRRARHGRGARDCPRHRRHGFRRNRRWRSRRVRASCCAPTARPAAWAWDAVRRCRRAGNGASRARAPDVSLRRGHAAHARHTAPLRVHQDRRRLRLSLRVLHHPHAARPLPQPSRARRSSPRRARWPPGA